MSTVAPHLESVVKLPHHLNGSNVDRILNGSEFGLLVPWDEPERVDVFMKVGKRERYRGSFLVVMQSDPLKVRMMT